MDENEVREEFKPYVRAHKHSSYHVDEIVASAQCACFYCERLFSPTEIVRWIDDDKTALCPYCSVDSVLGSAAGCPLDEKFLKMMHWFWFEQETERIWFPHVKN